MAIGESGKMAVLWRRDRQTRTDATPANNRFHRVFSKRSQPSVSMRSRPSTPRKWRTKYARNC
jgi:hypothetical protein